MRILAIIPARGGSKRIPRKNIREFAGRPMIQHSIDAARLAGCFEEIMVSTDDEETARIARHAGAKVPFMRSEATANDFATTADVINEVLDRYAALGREFDAICCLYATAPFVTPRRLLQGAAIIGSGEAKGAFTCVRYSYPIQRCLVRDNEGYVRMMFPEYATTRTQDLQPTYHDAGQFYFITVESFRKHNTLWAPETLPIVLPETEVQDIDTPEDWEIAEVKYATGRLPKSFTIGDFTLTSYTQLGGNAHEFILTERNKVEVRRQMVNREPIGTDEHLRFVKSLKQRNDCAYYAITNAAGEIAGSVNLHLTDTRQIERGIWITESCRGKGIAVKIMHGLYDWLKLNLGIETVQTMVRHDNAASNALERRLGAREVNRDEEYVYYELTL